MISNCGHDERGKYSRGKAGDQTGTEWQVINWYNRPWKCVLRHPDVATRKLIAQMAKAAAVNNMVGYCQSHRDFNPRSREGSDDGTQLSVRYGCYFNPRSREGSDQSHKPRTAILQAFQSALPRGERRCTSSGISVAM